MASGQTLSAYTPAGYEVVAADDNAGFGTRNNHPLLSFRSDGSGTSVTYSDVLPRHYAGGGLTVTLYWTSTATSGDVKWNAQFERMTTDLDTDSFAAAQTTTTSTSATSGVIVTTEISFTDGSQMDSLAAGESFRLKIARDTANEADTLAGIAQLHRVEIRET